MVLHRGIEAESTASGLMLTEKTLDPVTKIHR
jgi:hypothetical protein